MKIVNTTRGPGQLEGESVLLWDTELTVNELIGVGFAKGTPPIAEALPLAEVELLAPVIPSAIHAIGLNYRAHAAETGLPIPDHPLPMVIRSGAASHAGADIVLPVGSAESVDYESEICVVIGRAAANVTPEEALDHVAGLTLGNDVTARDIAMRALLNREFEVGLSKSFDTFKPFGPALVTLDEIEDLDKVDIKLRLNGELVQDSSSDEWIFDAAEMVSYLSQFGTLEPGDVIFTGSPSGVGMTRGRMLRAGDHVEVSSDVLGISLENNVVAGSGQ